VPLVVLAVLRVEVLVPQVQMEAVAAVAVVALQVQPALLVVLVAAAQK
jgi:hypothetical protein